MSTTSTLVGASSGGDTITISGSDGINVIGIHPDFTLALEPDIHTKIISVDGSININETSNTSGGKVYDLTTTLPSFIGEGIVTVTTANNPDSVTIRANGTVISSNDLRINSIQLDANTWLLELKETGITVIHNTLEQVQINTSELNILHTYTHALPHDTTLSPLLWEPVTDAGSTNLRIKYIGANVTTRRIRLSFSIRVAPGVTVPAIEVGIAIRLSQDDGATFYSLGGTPTFCTAIQAGWTQTTIEIFHRLATGDQLFPMFTGAGSGIMNDISYTSISFSIN